METYTPEQLTYISELEDRIDMLEALCEDYAEHIKQLETTQQDFKPISEMTIEDWQQALNEGWLFEDNEEDTCQVESVDKEMQLIGFDEYIGKFDIKGDYVDNHPYYITKRIK